MADAKIVISAVDQTKAAIDAAKRNMASLGETAGAISTRMGSIGLAIGAAFSAGSLIQVIDMLDKLDDMAEKTGISVEALSALRYAGESVGTTQEQMSAGLTKLTKLMGAAAGGNDQAALTFKQLGVEIQNADGTLRGTDQVLADLSQRFSAWEDGPAKAAAAMKVFGKSGEDMIPMLNLGASGLQSMASEATKLGAVFGADAAKNAADFNDHLTKIKLASEAAAVSLSGPLVKALADVSGAFIEAKKNGEGYFGMLARSASLMPKLPSMMDGIPMVRMFRLMQQSGDMLKAPKSTEHIQSYVNKFGTNAGGGRGTVNPRTAAPIIEDKTGNKPTTPKAPDHFADNFINQLITEYANLSGEMSKTEEVTRKLDTATEKFTGTQRQEILSWAALIDERKADNEWMQQQSASEADYRAARQASSDEVVSAINDVNAYTDAVQLETNVLELQANMRGQATSEVQKAVAVLRLKADLDARILKIQESSIPDSLKEVEIEKLRTASLQEQTNAMGVAADGYADYLSNMGTEAERMAGVVSGGFKSMEDALVNFTKTGKLDFTAMADSIVSDLMRIAIQQSITRPLAQSMGLFGLFGGSSAAAAGAPIDMTSIMAAKGASFDLGGARAFANGGMFTNSIVDSPTLFKFANGTGLMGEAGPEAIMPLTRGPGGRLGVQSHGAGSSAAPTHFTIVNQTSARITDVSEQRYSDTERALLLREAVNLTAAELSDPNSRTSRAMGRSYAVQRSR